MMATQISVGLLCTGSGVSGDGVQTYSTAAGWRSLLQGSVLQELYSVQVQGIHIGH